MYMYAYVKYDLFQIIEIRNTNKESEFFKMSPYEGAHSLLST